MSTTRKVKMRIPGESDEEIERQSNISYGHNQNLSRI